MNFCTLLLTRESSAMYSWVSVGLEMLMNVLITKVASVATGMTKREKIGAASGDSVLVQMGDILPTGALVIDRERRIDLSSEMDRYVVGEGDVLFRGKGAGIAAAVVPPDCPLLVAAAPIIILRPNRSLIEPGYLAWAVSSPAAMRHYMLTARSAGMLTVGATELGTLKIQAPDIETQRAVAELVSLQRRETALLERYMGLKQQFMDVAIEQRIMTGETSPQRKASRK
jgi:hypothetical protein